MSILKRLGMFRLRQGLQKISMHHDKINEAFINSDSESMSSELEQAEKETMDTLKLVKELEELDNKKGGS